MKNILPCLTVIGGAFLLGDTSTRAQYAPYQQYPYAPYSYGQFYLSGDVGGSLLQNLRIKNGGGDISFNPGTRADISFGYQIIDPLAVEIETGVLWNSLDSVSGTSLGSVGQRADLYQIPILANLVWRLPLQYGFSVYAGAGAGGVASELDLREHDGFDHWHHANDTDFTFAYQGLAGVKYALAPNMEVGVGYKFLGTLDHSWFDGDPNLSTRTGAAYSHSILASFSARF